MINIKQIEHDLKRSDRMQGQDDSIVWLLKGKTIIARFNNNEITYFGPNGEIWEVDKSTEVNRLKRLGTNQAGHELAAKQLRKLKHQFSNKASKTQSPLQSFRAFYGVN